jgi:hypothetical protein
MDTPALATLFPTTLSDLPEPGFPTLFSLLTDPPVISAIHKFASCARRAFPEDRRVLMCLGTSYDLLLAWGEGGRRPSSQDPEAVRLEVLRVAREAVASETVKPWWKVW